MTSLPQLSEASLATKPVATVADDGHRASTSPDWYEAHGIGRVNMKIKRFID